MQKTPGSTAANHPANQEEKMHQKQIKARPKKRWAKKKLAKMQNYYFVVFVSNLELCFYILI